MAAKQGEEARRLANDLHGMFWVLVIWICVIRYCFEFRASICEFLSKEREC